MENKYYSLLAFYLFLILIQSTKAGDINYGVTKMNLTILFKGLSIEITPEKLILAKGEGSTFSVYLAEILENEEEIPVNDARVFGTVIKPSGDTEELNFTFIGNGSYLSEYYTFDEIGSNKINLNIYSDRIGDYKSEITINVMSGAIRRLFPIGFNITTTPTLNFEVIPKSFIILMEKEKKVINLTIKNKEKFNLIVLANTFLESKDNLYKIIIPPNSKKSFSFIIKMKEKCAEKRFLISLYIRGGLEVTSPINRVDVPVRVFSICPSGKYPEGAYKQPIGIQEKNIIYLIILIIICIFIYWLKRRIT